MNHWLGNFWAQFHFIMVIHIVIAGKSNCTLFAQLCLVADHLSQKLPNFCYERIEKSTLEWPEWLKKINTKNNWHHVICPIIWKEVLMKGSKPIYIGSASDFLEYCHSYYDFDMYIDSEKFNSLVNNFGQYKDKLKKDKQKTAEAATVKEISITDQNNDTFIICLSGASCPLTKFIVSSLLDWNLLSEKKRFSKVFLYDKNCPAEFLESIEEECSHLRTNLMGKVVVYTNKIGKALAEADLLVVMDHVPFNPIMSIGEWLHANRKLMENLAVMINASAPRYLKIILANVGPACFNATVLMQSVAIHKNNIVVATSDLGLEVLDILSESTECPARRMFCPPVWGFVGINHLVDIHTTVHQYNRFDPYSRYYKVKNTTLSTGVITPEVRTMEYLTHIDDMFWVKVAERKKILPPDKATPSKAEAVLNLIKVWIYENDTDCILTLGIRCDGTFGLTFEGVFSQPARLCGREWRPAKEFFYPRERFVKLSYLEYMARFMMSLGSTELPPIVPVFPNTFKRDFVKKKK